MFKEDSVMYNFNLQYMYKNSNFKIVFNKFNVNHPDIVDKGLVYTAILLNTNIAMK